MRGIACTNFLEEGEEAFEGSGLECCLGPADIEEIPVHLTTGEGEIEGWTAWWEKSAVEAWLVKKIEGSRENISDTRSYFEVVDGIRRSNTWILISSGRERGKLFGGMAESRCCGGDRKVGLEVRLGLYAMVDVGS